MGPKKAIKVLETKDYFPVVQQDPMVTKKKNNAPSINGKNKKLAFKGYDLGLQVSPSALFCNSFGHSELQILL